MLHAYLFCSNLSHPSFQCFWLNTNNKNHNNNCTLAVATPCIVFHNWYTVIVVLFLPFSDFLTLSLIQGLFSWTQETLFKVGGITTLFFSQFCNLASFCQSLLIIICWEYLCPVCIKNSACSHFRHIYVSNNYFA